MAYAAWSNKRFTKVLSKVALSAASRESYKSGEMGDGQRSCSAMASKDLWDRECEALVTNPNTVEPTPKVRQRYLSRF